MLSGLKSKKYLVWSLELISDCSEGEGEGTEAQRELGFGARMKEKLVDLNEGE